MIRPYSKTLNFSLGAILFMVLLSTIRVSPQITEKQIVYVNDTIMMPCDTCTIMTDFFVREVIGTPYQPTFEQCDSTPYNTADGSFIDTNLLKTYSIRWCSLSQDLLWFNGGPFHYGDTVWAYSDDDNIRGTWIAHDAMNPKHTNRIDFLQWFDNEIHKTDGIVISNKPINSLTYQEP